MRPTTRRPRSFFCLWVKRKTVAVHLWPVSATICRANSIGSKYLGAISNGLPNRFLLDNFYRFCFFFSFKYQFKCQCCYRCRPLDIVSPFIAEFKMVLQRRTRHSAEEGSGLINNIYVYARGPRERIFHGVQNSSVGPLSPTRTRRVHAAGSLMEDVIGKYLARLRSMRRRVCSRNATNRVIARILLLSAL